MGIFGFLSVFVVWGVVFVFDRMLYNFCSEFDEKTGVKKWILLV